jgi:hypothetical protein
MGAPCTFVSQVRGKSPRTGTYEVRRRNARIGFSRQGLGRQAAASAAHRRQHRRIHGRRGDAGGLALATPTALTGLIDWLGIEKGTPWRTTATIHLCVMLTATVLFGLTFVSHLDGYDDGLVETLPLVLGLAALATLALGGYIGGTLVFVYGVRVLKREDVSVKDALIPGRADRPPAPGE